MGQELDHRLGFTCRDHAELQAGGTHHRNIQHQLFDRRLVDLLNVVKVPAEKVITGKNEYGSRVPVGRY